MVTLLAGYGIALRAGQHCAQPLLAALGVSGTLRASLRPIIPKAMLTRWLPPLTAPLKYWWINDYAALAGHPFGTVITEETLKQTFAPLHSGKINIAS
jgi:hypothetical protein